jgi:hypothetical protein
MEQVGAGAQTGKRTTDGLAGTAGALLPPAAPLSALSRAYPTAGWVFGWPQMDENPAVASPVSCPNPRSGYHGAVEAAPRRGS